MLTHGVNGANQQQPISAGGATAAVTITRPSNTTAYNAGDVIGQADTGTPANAGTAILHFQNMGAPGTDVLIVSADLRIDLSSVPSGMTSFRLHLYDTSPTAILDNASWDLPSGDRAPYLGYIDLGSIVDVGSTLFVQAEQVNKLVKLAANSTSLYGELVTNGGYTPASGTTHQVRLNGIGA